MDTETTGLELFGGSRVVGISIANVVRGFYYPWGHPEGPQFEREKVLAWLKDVLRGREVYLAHAKFDLHMLRKEGLDLEALDCRVRDVQFHAALLYEQRRRYGLDDLGKEFLGQGKVSLPDVPISSLPSDLVGPYAERDAHLTFRLARFFAPKIAADGLEAVRDLEDDLIYPVCEMERNGALLDLDKLETWRDQCQSRYAQEFLRLAYLAGSRINVNSTSQLYKLLCLRGIKHPNPSSVTMEDLRKYEKDEAIAAAINARRYSSLLSKYLDKYVKAVGRDGILRFNLNQLRSDDYGTVTGRFSSSDVNIQQVFSDDRQEGVAAEFPIRELFIASRDHTFVSADASQIEFRLFGHYADDRHVTAVYRLEPNTDFHKMVAKLTGLPRDPAKHINFGKLYGMGIDKMRDQIKLRWREKDGPLPSDTRIEEMFYEYDRKFPATKLLSMRAAKLAEQRGYVRTFLGRRRRYKDGDKTHSALNAVIQGTAADVMKVKLRELYRERKTLGLTMRFTVHDEMDGDLEPGKEKYLEEFLDQQSLELRVPILWDVGVGPNWKIAKKGEPTGMPCANRVPHAKSTKRRDL